MKRQQKECIRCDKPIDIKSRRRMFCSIECCQMFPRKYQNSDWKLPRKCIYCKKEYTPNSSNQKLCSKECASVFNSFEYKCNNGGVSGWEKIRFEVFKRDNFTCQYCGRNVKDDGIKLHCDHIHPKSKGGQDVVDNLITACKECNLGKRDVLLDNKIL